MIASRSGYARYDTEVVSVVPSQRKRFWDIAIADEPHLFALASGVLSHNTNPAPKVHIVTYQAAVEPFAMFTKGRNVFNVENGGLAHNVFRYPTPMGPERVHPTQKPVGLLEELIRNSSQPGDLVVDPYCGSGSTGEAARRMDRRFYGSDLDWTYLTHFARYKAERAVSSAGLEHLPLFGGPLDSAS